MNEKKPNGFLRLAVIMAVSIPVYHYTDQDAMHSSTRHNEITALAYLSLMPLAIAVAWVIAKVKTYWDRQH